MSERRRLETVNAGGLQRTPNPSNPVNWTRETDTPCVEGKPRLLCPTQATGESGPSLVFTNQKGKEI